MIAVEANATFEATTLFFGIEGLAGSLEVKILDNIGNTVFGPTTLGISEIDTGFYSKPDMTAPGTAGQYSIVWKGGPFDDLAVEDLVVSAAGVIPGDFPIVPAEGPDQPVMGPCAAWTTGADVAICAGVEVGSDNEALLDQVAVEASMLLYRLSGYQYGGQCDYAARPCSTRRGCLHEWGLFEAERGFQCGCGSLSQVVLTGYPVTSITEVLIDGEVIDPDTYRLETDWMTLTRVRDPAEPRVRLFWPACQDRDQDDLTQPGTFVVRYLAGVNPPPYGERAAAELGAELLRACPGGTGSGEACRLPSGITQITRQGVTMNFDGFRSFAFDRGKRAWNTGLVLVDTFLNAENPTGRSRPSAFFSPDDPYYAERSPIESS